MYRSHVLICGGTGCTSSGSVKVREALAEQLKAKGLEDEIKIVQTGCFGLCAKGPIMVIYPEGTFYHSVKADDVTDIIEQHVIAGKPVERLLHKENDGRVVDSLKETEFMKKQVRLALRNCGVIDPENIDEFLVYQDVFSFCMKSEAYSQHPVCAPIPRSRLFPVL